MSTTKGKSASKRAAGSSTLANIYNLSSPQVEERINDCISHLSQQLADPLGGAFSISGPSGLAGRGADDPVKNAAKESLEELKELSRVYGLDAKEAHACVRMALGLPVTGFEPADQEDRELMDSLSSHPPHVPNQTLGAKFLKLILPRPGAVYGKDLVLDVLGCLGPAPGALEAPAAEKKKRNRSAAASRSARDGDEDTSDGEEEEAVTKTKEKKKSNGKPFRRHVHLKVQVSSASASAPLMSCSSRFILFSPSP